MNQNDNLPTSALLAYARQRINEAGLSSFVHAGVFIESSGSMVEINKDHPKWYSLAPDRRTRVEVHAVTVADEFAWFDCRRRAEVDTAIELFIRTYPATQPTKRAA